MGLPLPLVGEASLALIRFSVIPPCLLLLRLAGQLVLLQDCSYLNLSCFAEHFFNFPGVWGRRGEHMGSICHVERQVGVTLPGDPDAGVSACPLTCC